MRTNLHLVTCCPCFYNRIEGWPEHFSYYLADCPGVIDELLECNTQESVARIEGLPEGHGIEAVFCWDGCGGDPPKTPEAVYGRRKLLTRSEGRSMRLKAV